MGRAVQFDGDGSIAGRLVNKGEPIVIRSVDLGGDAVIHCSDGLVFESFTAKNSKDSLEIRFVLIRDEASPLPGGSSPFEHFSSGDGVLKESKTMTAKSEVSWDKCSFFTVTVKKGDVAWYGYFSDCMNAQVATWLIESADSSGKVAFDKFEWPGRYQESARRFATKGMIRVGLYLDELIRMDRGYENDRTEPVRSMFVREDKAGRVSFAIGSVLDTFEADLFGGRNG